MRGIVTTPGYPHGTKQGYFNGCSCEDCRHARQTAEKMREHAHRVGKPLPTDLIDAQPVRDYVDGLRADCPGATVEAVARVAGVTATAIGDLFNLNRPTIRRRTADKILAVTVEQVAVECEFVDAQPYREKVRRLQAAGWPLSYVARQTGCCQFNWLNKTEQRWITARVAKKVDAVADRIGIRLATPANSGLSQRSINLTARQARRLGYYPPGCYNDDGTLEPRAIPGHPWANADDRAAARLETLRLLAAGRTPHEISRMMPGVQERSVNRFGAAVGFYDPDRRDQVLTAIRDALDAYDDGTLDVVHAALRLGVIGHVPPDHPGRLAWQAEVAARDAAQKRLGTAA